MNALTPYNFKCPNLACRVEYVAVHRKHSPERKPRCIECETPFLARESGLHIHYEAACPVTFLPPDAHESAVLSAAPGHD